MSVYKWQQPQTTDTSGRILEGCSNHVKIPDISIIEGQPGGIETLWLGEVILECRCYIIRVARLRYILISKSVQFSLTHLK